jgi:phosphate transport system substrate-binding protein
MTGKALVATALATALVLAGCSQTPSNSAGGTPIADLDLHRDIVLAGSNTIGAELAAKLLKSYAHSINLSTGNPRHFVLPDSIAGPLRALHNPQCDLDKASPEDFIEVPITGTPAPGQPHYMLVAALGSGCSAVMVGNGLANVGMSSRPIKAEEAQTYAAFGPWQGKDPTARVDSRSPYERVIGLDGIVVLANRQGWPGPLAREEVRAIFSGANRDWMGPDNTHHVRSVFVRKPGSGTRDTFKSLIMGDTPLAADAIAVDDQDALIRKIAATPGSIGYSGFGAAQRQSGLIVPINECGLVYRAVKEAGKSMVKTEDYPLTRRLYFYTPGRLRAGHPAHAENAIDFADFVRSENGQSVVDSLFVSLRVESVDTRELRKAALAADKYPRDTWTNFYERELLDNPAAEQLGSTIRFGSGAIDLDPRATDDLQRVRTYLRSPAMSGKRLIAIGFADSRGAGLQQLSQARAAHVGEQLTKSADRFVLQAQVNAIGLGARMPAACNADDAGRQHNRRVELWVTPPIALPTVGTEEAGSDNTGADRAWPAGHGHSRREGSGPSPYKVYIPDPVTGN